MDSEIAAMSAVAEALSKLEPDVQARVIRWAAERFGVGTPELPTDSGASPPADDGGSPDSAEGRPFSEFAELYSAAQPRTNEEKALVAAYWVQAIRGQDSWPSRALNSELRNLGHAVANITDALTGAISRKPQRVLQLRKSGKSQQANKTYKLTTEGIAYVEGLLNRAA